MLLFHSLHISVPCLLSVPFLTVTRCESALPRRETSDERSTLNALLFRYELALLCLFTGNAGCGKESDPTPLKAETISVVHDFGIVQPNFIGAHRFEIRNSSSTIWTLQKVVEACSCTTTDLSWNTIACGQTVPVTVNYRTGDVSRSERRGIRLTFREREAPEVELTLSAVVQSPLVLEPAEVFLSVAPNGLITTKLDAKAYGARAPTDLTVNGVPDWIKVSITKVFESEEHDLDATQASRQWRVDLTISSRTAAQDSQRAILGITAIHSDRTQLNRRVPVQLPVKRRFMAVPSRINLGDTPGASDARCEASVRIHALNPLDQSREPPSIRIVGELCEQLQAVVRPCKLGWDLKVTAKDLSSLRSSANTHVELKWDESVDEKVTLPVSVVVRSSLDIRQ